MSVGNSHHKSVDRSNNSLKGEDVMENYAKNFASGLFCGLLMFAPPLLVALYYALD